MSDFSRENNKIVECDKTLTLEKGRDAGSREIGVGGCLVYITEAERADRGRTLMLVEGSAVIGRDEDCDLSLRDASVSRKHVRLTVQKRGILVEDLGSKNKITYMGKEVDRVLLVVGSRFNVGKCAVDLLPRPAPGSVPISTVSRYGGLVGASIPMRRLYALLGMIENSDVPVIVEGETGTGKELLAEAIHEHSGRCDRPFVVVDCGNMPASLMESELYGYRRGAFTGANSDRAGIFESAESGTVFLDEIDELPLALQPKLLRTLETGQVKRLGAVKHIDIDIRIIASSKRDLKAKIDEGKFRDDLYYRIAVMQLRLPALRERKEDIPLLVRHFATSLSKGSGQQVTNDVLESYLNYGWPGNVRELRNAVQRALLLGSSAKVASAAPAVASDEAGNSNAEFSMEYRIAREQTIERFDRDYLSGLMDRHGGNQSAAARAAGISRSYLRELLKKTGLL